MAKHPVIGWSHTKKGTDHIDALRYTMQQMEDARIDALFAKAMREREIVDFAIPAIRGWHLHPQSGLLTAVSMQYEYLGPVVTNDRRPAKHGESGFWAVKPGYLNIVERYHPQVVGAIELSGIVVEHEFGYRGEICAIQKLYVIDDPHSFGPGFIQVPAPNIPFLEDTYQCDVFQVEHFNHLNGKRILQCAI